MLLHFTKMHGLGNDFVVIDNISQRIRLRANQIKALANRHTGVGFDQLLMVEPPSSPDADFFYRIFNADGAEVAQCGNGARCFARFVKEKGLTHKNKIVVETNTSTMRIRFETDDMICVDMGRPKFEPNEIPLVAEKASDTYTVCVGNKMWTFGAVSMGNPHAVILVDDVKVAPVKKIGKLLERNKRFPQGVNVGFMEVVDRQNIRLRVFERGAGETLACGSGACAAVVVGRQQQLLDDTVNVTLPGGQLAVKWSKPTSQVQLTGPAVKVFEGRVKI